MNLHGKKILVTRPQLQAEKTLRELRELGAEPVLFPLIEITKPSDNFASLDFALQNLQYYDWIIFTSQNAVKYFFSRPSAPMLESVDANFAAVGPETEKLLRELGAENILVPEQHSSAGLVEKFQPVPLQKKQILFPRAKEGRDEIVKGLSKLGAQVSVVEAYQTIMPTDLDPDEFAEVLQEVDVVYFASPSVVKNYLQLCQELQLSEKVWKLPALVIGETTAAEAEKFFTLLHHS